MLKSDRIYFARYALDPEMELDDLDLYFDNENEELAEAMTEDWIFENQSDDSFFEDQDELEQQ